MDAQRVAIVTGSGPGIGGLGPAIAAGLAAQHYQLLLADLNPAVEDIAARLRDEYRVPVLTHVGNLADEAVVTAMVDKVVAEFGRIDVLVNNAGGGIITPFLQHSAATLTETLNRNLWPTLWCCHKVLPHMVTQNFGRIVNIGADSLRTGIPGHAGYNAAKGGVVGLMVGLAKEFALHNITVNTVSPCLINTPRHQERRISDPELARAFEQVIPKARGAEFEEVVRLVCFLADESNAFITGQEISINGGSAMP